MGSYVWPCPNYSRVSSPFEYRTNPISKQQELHRGADLACPAGRPILATKSGTVKEAKYNSSYGNYVLLDHGGGLQSRYAHASKLLVSAGKKVAAGEEIAQVGSTGNSTGAHLHFEIIAAGKPQNPLDYVSDKDTAQNHTSGSGSSKDAADGGQTGADDNKEITHVIVKNKDGIDMAEKSFPLLEKGAFIPNGCELIIQNDCYYYPMLKDEITWETERQDTPGKLTFTVLKDDTINFQEGNPVRFRANNQDVFYGYVFSKQRSDKDFISVTCYDQLRYLKNKSTMSYDNMKYSDLLRKIAGDFGLQCGTIDDTEYVIQHRIEETSLFDMLGNAADITIKSTQKVYVLFDDFGKLSLRNVESLITDVLIDGGVAYEYQYTSGIDNDTYNKIMLAYDNKKTGNRELTIEQDGSNQNKWGVLQYYKKIDDNVTNPAQTAKNLLYQYNQKWRSLNITKILGNVQVRAGSSVTVLLGLGDINVSKKCWWRRQSTLFRRASILWT